MRFKVRKTMRTIAKVRYTRACEKVFKIIQVLYSFIRPAEIFPVAHEEDV